MEKKRMGRKIPRKKRILSLFWTGRRYLLLIRFISIISFLKIL